MKEQTTKLCEYSDLWMSFSNFTSCVFYYEHFLPNLLRTLTKLLFFKSLICSTTLDLFFRYLHRISSFIIFNRIVLFTYYNMSIHYERYDFSSCRRQHPLDPLQQLLLLPDHLGRLTSGHPHCAGFRIAGRLPVHHRLLLLLPPLILLLLRDTSLWRTRRRSRWSRWSWRAGPAIPLLPGLTRSTRAISNCRSIFIPFTLLLTFLFP